MESMYSNQVWDLIVAFEGIKLIQYKWVYKRKRGVDGKVETFKARHGVVLSQDQNPKTLEEVEQMRKFPYDSAVGSFMGCTDPNFVSLGPSCGRMIARLESIHLSRRHMTDTCEKEFITRRSSVGEFPGF
ncbi:hypothetical protein CRG98_005360 [Punica granatum]|uniref:Uncharacterized protein n=1 Tax=Punica granatum TaxID=22663 RepID=A0A2I0L0L2_PUNGR|nr:hypothetical protein CRG98_005360 [Punica granatum]